MDSYGKPVQERLGQGDYVALQGIALDGKDDMSGMDVFDDGIAWNGQGDDILAKTDMGGINDIHDLESMMGDDIGEKELTLIKNRLDPQGIDMVGFGCQDILVFVDNDFTDADAQDIMKRTVDGVPGDEDVVPVISVNGCDGEIERDEVLPCRRLIKGIIGRFGDGHAGTKQHTQKQ